MTTITKKTRKTSGLTTLKSLNRNINDAIQNKILTSEEIEIMINIYLDAKERYISNITIK